eukprot:gene19909-26612_t
MEMRRETSTVVVSKSLSMEALMSRLNAGGYAPPVMLHSSLAEIKVGNDSLATVSLKIRNLSRQNQTVKVGLFRNYDSRDPKKGFLTEVKKEMGMSPSDVIRQVPSEEDDEGRPKPPYMSTVTQLGLTNAPGMPKLLDASALANTSTDGCGPLQHQLCIVSTLDVSASSAAPLPAHSWPSA